MNRVFAHDNQAPAANRRSAPHRESLLSLRLLEHFDRIGATRDKAGFSTRTGLPIVGIANENEAASRPPCSRRQCSPGNRRNRKLENSPVLKVKDTLRATVHLTFDGRVIKAYHGPNAPERFANEVRVLRHLETRACGFVPRLLEADPAQCRIVTTNCGSRVEHLDHQRLKELFAELEAFGVRHDDPDARNVTYRRADGRFCLIDFEFATILPEAARSPVP